MNKEIKIVLLITLHLLVPGGMEASGQDRQRADSQGIYQTRVEPSKDYLRSGFHRFLFGRHYRREWATPVTLPSIRLDTAFGGLTPYQRGGGRQTNSLRMRDRQKREYVLRSLEKSLGRAIPPIMHGTFVEDLIDDQVTTAHPYAPITIPPLAEAAQIYHTHPVLAYVPEQTALDTFNRYYANEAYLLEQRPDENWSTAPNLGRSANLIGTEKLLERLGESSSRQVDQRLYVRCRLFDMIIGDWSRHEDQWRWASQERNGGTLYQPVPRDRDQAYSLFDGLLVGTVLSIANLDHLQSFGNRIKEVKSYNYPARHLDRRMANETTLSDWQAEAAALKTLLTDEIIEAAVRRLPPEVFPVSGPRIISDIKSRRDRIAESAAEYYRFLARHVDIPGSEDPEYFEVKRLNDEETSVRVFQLTREGNRMDTPFYVRVFKKSETKDIRLYGRGGSDVFDLEGSVSKGITVRIMGGAAYDSIQNRSVVAREHGKTVVYDDPENAFIGNKDTKLRLHTRDSVRFYRYHQYEYHKKGFRPSLFYDNPDRLYAGIGYAFKRRIWRREPYGFEQGLHVRYSISQNAFSLLYDGEFYQIAGKWNGRIWVNQDFIRWTNFYGLGNETVNLKTAPRRYYQLRTNEFLGNLGVYRQFGTNHQLDLTGFFSAVEVVGDPDRYVSQHYTPNELYYFHHHRYAGARIGYTYQNVDDPVVPERGVMAYGGATYTANVREGAKAFATYNAIVHAFIPVGGKFSLSLRAGLASIDGEAEFFQYPSIGGSQTLRGYRRDRFWGRTAFYNTNELRWLTDVRSYLMNGKLGFMVFADNGRVWMPREHSQAWHWGYGGGFILAPFNMFTASVGYGLSAEEGRFHIRVTRMLRLRASRQQDGW